MSIDEFSGVRDLNRAAVLGAAAVACRVRAPDLGRATPCPEWTVAGLLSHLSVQHRGFAAAARGNGGDLAVWAPRPPAADPVADFLAATAEVLTAFGAAGVRPRRFRLPEISSSAEFPAARAIRFHFIDYVVHGWDLARSIGVPLPMDQAVLEAAWEVARQVPDTARGRPGSPFGPPVAVPPGVPLLDRIVAHLGRSPDWEPPATQEPAARPPMAQEPAARPPAGREPAAPAATTQ
ncbi:MAG TPA: TIGR03086 family metal-binding protein [Streptosporangiaceae bacterium]|jgi:uncharacterized protein (TIGR03086 family)|nr:TIGR03086 family metal-binding protein [Streptosporangiaceae bacterium]